jgi:acyl phosphate:glycerol-3-phosphate acyltransferase
MTIVDIGAVVLGYLLGSIPFGLVLTRLAGLGDIRKLGSGNIGATNVLRTGNKAIAALTLFLDAAKGAAAVWIAGRYATDFAPIAGAAAFLGHCFPLWLKFKGGKGVATFLGVLIAFSWPAAAVTALIWVGVASTFRFASLASLVSATLAPFLLLAVGTTGQAVAAFAMLVLVFIRHAANIRRLRDGTEPRIGSTSQK